MCVHTCLCMHVYVCAHVCIYTCASNNTLVEGKHQLTGIITYNFHHVCPRFELRPPFLMVSAFTHRAILPAPLMIFLMTRLEELFWKLCTW